MFRKKGLWQGLMNIFVFLLALSLLASAVLEANRTAVDNFFGEVSEKMVSEEGETYSAYVPDAQFLNADGKTGNSTALIKAAIDLGRRLEAEGAVLLKNDGALPLAKGSKVTLLGARSHRTLINSSMGQKSQGNYITLEQALSATKTDFANTKLDNKGAVADYNFSDLKYGGDGVGAGAGFTLNPTTIAAYQSTSGNMNLQQAAGNNYTVNEPSLAKLEEAAENGFVASFKSYNDAAIVVIGRGAGESNDYRKGGLNASEKTDTITEPLQLTQNEIDIINAATANFSKVIVLLNNNSAIEVGDLKNNPKINAILWVGNPGNYGTLGIADILCGNVSPSGGLYDIYATKNLSAPAMMNMGQYQFSNYSEGTRTNRSRYYVMEAESIYVGYRYYETRYNDVVYNQGNAKSTTGTYASTGDWNYAQEVAYGFGYGLGYTTFSYELSGPTINQTAHEIYATFTVKVTNTGTVAGKAPVQIYGQAPWTAYDRTNKVEKSAIQLVAFDKTGLLQPNASQTLTIEVDLQNLASYDETWENADGTKGSYILDSGDYYFAVGNGAHDALNNVLAAQGKTTSDGMDYNGNANLAKKWTYNYAGTGTVDYTTFGISKNNAKVSNQIQYINWNNFSGEPVTILSRTDWAGTYPKEYTDMAVPADMFPLLNGKIPTTPDGKSYYTISTTDDVSAFTWGSTKTSYKFYEMVKADWNDYRWNDLMDQIALEEATVFAAVGGPNFSIALTGVDFKAFSRGTDNAGNGIVFDLNNSADKDAPWTIPADDPNAAWNPQVFGCAPLVASTFDPAIMFELGNFVGNEALFVGLPIVWGPGLNTHRHAYNGRNGEYYSEDPVLSGTCALEFAVAAGRKGLVASPKHFVFNDQETQRNGVAPFMTEQRAREVELRAYQIAIEAVKYRETGEAMFGLMTSFSKCGPVEVTNSWGMLTGILQNEWGFHGYAVSDISDDKDLYTGIVYAGMTGYDLRSGYPQNVDDITRLGNQVSVDGIQLSNTMFAKDATMQAALKNSVKRTLWSFAHSNLMNRYSASTHVESVMTSWRVMYTVAIAVTGALALAAGVLYVISALKGKKEDA